MKWVLADHDEAEAAHLGESAELPSLIARLLVIRGIRDADAARSFLNDGLSSLSDPYLFSGMDRAADRVLRAIAAGEQIVVYGDYDVDGVAGAAVLTLALLDAGARVSPYIPDRITEGYGLNAQAIATIREQGAGLVISVDCGISALREASAARALGLDLIITDHHEIAAAGGEGAATGGTGLLPEAFAVLHPDLLVEGAGQSLRERVAVLTGAGMAFKLAQAVLSRCSEDGRVLHYLDLVTLGTVADMGKLTGENRVIVKAGLEQLSASPELLRPGIAALKEVSGIGAKRVTAGTVGFTLGPRINASGRLASADSAFRLLTTTSREEAASLARQLDAVNRERQALEQATWEEARELCLQQDSSSPGALVLASSSWHPGVIGIVASRIADEFYRPAVLLAIRDGIAKGSGRSIPGFDLYGGLTRCAEILSGFGGHTYAAGLTVAEAKIPEFRERLSAVAREQLGAAGFVRKLTIDGPVRLDELTMELLESLERLAPFGQGNPEPRLGAKGLEVVSSRVVGAGHLKFRVRHGSGPSFEAIAFNRAEAFAGRVCRGARLAAIFTPRLNSWNGSASIELDIKDVKREH